DKVGADPMVEIAPSEPKGFKALMHLGPGAKLGEWKADPSAGRRFDSAIKRPDAATPIDYLAHFSWHIIQDVNFKWNSEVPAQELVHKRLESGDIKLGPPSPLPTVAPPFTNDLSDEATKVILNGKAKPPNL